jgi:hypothetical protein
VLLIIVTWERPLRYYAIKSCAGPLVPPWFNLYNNISWHNESNAFSRSKNVLAGIHFFPDIRE